MSEPLVQTADPAISDRSFREEALASLRSYLATGDSGAGDASSDALTVDEQANLFEAGVLDSLQLVGMIGFIESEFECSLDYDELTEDNLGTLAAILAMIERKRAASS
jgi:acyl carrier protein